MLNVSVHYETFKFILLCRLKKIYIFIIIGLKHSNVDEMLAIGLIPIYILIVEFGPVSLK